MVDWDRVRGDFPILDQEVNGNPLVYFDNAATSQTPRPVIEAITEYYEKYNSNVHRGAHALSDRATVAYEDARESVAEFIGAAESRECIFVRNTTEALNLVAYSWAMNNLEEGDEILLSVLEHHSNIIPWQLVSQRTGAQLRYVELTPEGELDRESFSRQLSNRTRLVALSQMSNVLGTITPATELVREAHDAGAVTVLDGAQAVPHLPVDVQEIDCDFMAFSGHKMCGPTGIGVLYGKEELLEQMPPFQGGGEMIGRVERDSATWADLPQKFEAGTPSIAQAVGLHAAVEYLSDIGMEAIRDRERELAGELIPGLRRIDGVTVHGNARERGALASFSIEDIHPHDVSQVMDEEGIAIRAGHHCTQPLMSWLGEAATARASLYFYNRPSEIERFFDAVQQVKEFFGHVAV